VETNHNKTENIWNSTWNCFHSPKCFESHFHNLWFRDKRTSTPSPSRSRSPTSIENRAVMSSRTSDPYTVIYLMFIQLISVTAFSTLFRAWHPSVKLLDNQNDVFSPEVRLWPTINLPLFNNVFPRLCTIESTNSMLILYRREEV
jgi:hypothetical protein